MRIRHTYTDPGAQSKRHGDSRGCQRGIRVVRRAESRELQGMMDELRALVP